MIDWACVCGSTRRDWVATNDEVAEEVTELYDHCADERTIMGMPRVVQSWGATCSAAA